MRKYVLIALSAVAPFAARPALADVTLNPLFADDMVLQQDLAVPVWGTADAGEDVTVSTGGQKKATKADDKGKWMVRLDALKPGPAIEVTVAGKNTVTLKNVLVGEVWVASGQSNMEMSVGSSKDAAAEIAAADYPQIREFAVPHVTAPEGPRDTVAGKWNVCSPKTAGRFSAPGYFFARHLHQQLKVPVGILHTSWGGMPAEAFTSRAVLEADEAFKPMVTRWDEALKSFTPDKQKAYDDAMKTWRLAEAAAKKEGKKSPPRPPQPMNPAAPNRPANLYNSMIHPLIPYAIRGAIWYQGESNAGQPELYAKLFPAMIANWRKDWGQGDFAFGFVQLASFAGGGKADLERQQASPPDTNWARLRESQTKTLAFPNTGMAVAIDIGDAFDIHPKNKQDVGLRLALWAMAKTYGQNVEYSGPMYESMKVQGNKALLTFSHAKGLAAKGDKLVGFAVAGEDGKFVWADAKVAGDGAVEVSSAEVAVPAAVRYGWGDFPAVNLYNAAGLPAVPFRTDNWALGKAGAK